MHTLRSKINERDHKVSRFHKICKTKKKSIEGVAKLALEAKFDDFGIGSVSRKSTYPIGHRQFARNPNPTPKGFATPSINLVFFSNFSTCNIDEENGTLFYTIRGHNLRFCAARKLPRLSDRKPPHII